MSGGKHPSVRLSPLVSSNTGDGEGVEQEALVMDLASASSNKFGFAWPAESSNHVLQPATSERPVTLSSSEGESDISESESATPEAGRSLAHTPDETDAILAHRLKPPPQALGVQERPGPVIPKMSRALSIPLSSQLGSLQNPRRVSPNFLDSSSPISDPGDKLSPFHELSLELADSVQTMIQTLLQVSPAQMLDPVKEQFAACSLSVPTPSMSAMFTTMKNLNYMAAHMADFCGDAAHTQSPNLDDSSFNPFMVDFDIGETLQSVGDSLSGAAAQIGVDLVLFHGDVGMRHVTVRGDETGLSYALSHVVRQVINTSQKGESVEIGLFIDAQGSTRNISSADLITDELLECTFNITHKSASSPGSPSTPHPRPAFDTLLFRRLLSHLPAIFELNPSDVEFAAHSEYKLKVRLERGSSSVVDNSMPSLDEIPYPLLSGSPIASEPTLEELLLFVETLRGRKVTLHASSKAAFAHRLTSYFTAWGMDVSHVSPESGMDGDNIQDEPTAGTTTPHRASPITPLGLALEGLSLPPSFTLTGTSSPSPEAKNPGSQPPSFVFIDDDVAVLQSRLQKFRLDQLQKTQAYNRKRPSLANNHRPRSSPQVARTLGLAHPAPHSMNAVVIVHFTSLSNFKLAKDVIQTALASHTGSLSLIPEVLIIPKPAGPRRLLTALHTAVTKPMVDPFFTPIATSPISPSIQGSSYFLYPPGASTSPKSPLTSKPHTASRANSDRSTRSPKETIADTSHLPPPSPLGMSDGMEYFSESAVKLGTSPSSGLVIQSPDGQPAGIFFHPRARSSRSSSNSFTMERDKGQLLQVLPPDRSRMVTPRRPLDGEDQPSQGRVSFSSLHAASFGSPNPDSQTVVETRDLPETHGSSLSTVNSKGKPNSPRTTEHLSVRETQSPASPATRRSSPFTQGARTLSSPPQSPLPDSTAGPSNPAPRRPTARRPTIDIKPSTSHSASKKGKGPADSNIVVPPISVLIVDDNHIQQNILSTFMKKKKIKYDVASNGEEAVQKWMTGGFHLILMDIQMPVMDGIQATKEIRRMEKTNAIAGYPPGTPVEEKIPLQTPSDTTSADSRSTASPYRSSVIIVALTASSLQSDRVAALAAGCNDFLTKPVSLLWLNSKIIEWGSIKALQMWADLRPEAVKSISSEQQAQARNVAQKLHVPEGRSTPVLSRSRSPSLRNSAVPLDTPLSASPSVAKQYFPSTSDAQTDLKPSSESTTIASVPDRPAQNVVKQDPSAQDPPPDKSPTQRARYIPRTSYLLDPPIQAAEQPVVEDAPEPTTAEDPPGSHGENNLLSGSH